MQMLHVNGTDMAYLELGQGRPLVCVHGSLCDFRIWSAVLGPLKQHHRVIAVSLRHFFPERWDGASDTYSIGQHVADVIAFIEELDTEPVDLMGHSRGGHIAFRVAQQRPDLLRRLVLAEPGGELDATLDPTAKPGPSPLAARIAASAEKIAAGDVEGGLKFFFDAIEGAGAWARVPAPSKQQLRDNAFTLIGKRATGDRRFQRPTRNRSGIRRCSSAAPTPRARCRRCCARWRRMCLIQRLR
jgi:pimeloyl-ACP methyl ester carboxylesterase